MKTIVIASALLSLLVTTFAAPAGKAEEIYHKGNGDQTNIAIDAFLQLEKAEKAAKAPDKGVKCDFDPICKRQVKKSVEIYHKGNGDQTNIAIDALLKLEEAEKAAKAPDKAVNCQSDPICFLGKREIKKSEVPSPIKNGGYQKRAEVMSDQTTYSDKGPRRME
ncbi:hypothetical protein Bbelb_218860 [Branchiostoma belcheri]|nr:hypothetical protein Bbelb_218860 [Branchiostoma belcheri]